MALPDEERALNPRSEPDPRFDPADDAENASAHGVEGDEEGDREEELQQYVSRLVKEAKDYYESALEPDQKKATDYYWGRPFGNEKENRSQAVSPVVRNAVLDVVPSMMRIVFGPEHIVEFEARREEQEEEARQRTDYVRYIITEDNTGFLHFLACVKDALVRRLGFFKWWWDESHRTERTRFTRLSQEDIVALAMEESVEEIQIEKTHPDGSRDATVVHHVVEGRARFMTVPSEEIWFSPDARSVNDARCFVHARELGIDEVVALQIEGVDREFVEEFADREKKARSTGTGGLRSARQFHGGDAQLDTEEQDESTRRVLLAEAYVLVKADPDEHPERPAERRLFRCLGPEFEVVGPPLGEIVDGPMKFTSFTPDPEPHTLVGMSHADKLMDIQLQESQVLRGTFDSLSEAVSPMTAIVEGQVNPADVLKPDASRVVRVRRPGMLEIHKHPFVGADTLPMLEYFKAEREERAGAAAIDADALQSSTKAAVAATVTKSQEQVEMLVRVFAETALKDLCRGLDRLVIENQDKARVVRLRGNYVSVDPRSWDSSLAVRVNVALGQGTPEDRLNTLAGIVSSQLTLMQAGSPFVSNVELRAALAQGAELAGYRHPTKFFRPWTAQDEAQLQQQRAAQPPPPDPATIVAQAEAAKAQAEIQKMQAEMELKRLQVFMEDDRERDRMAADQVLREYEIEAKYGADVVDSQLKVKIAQARAAQRPNESAT